MLLPIITNTQGTNETTLTGYIGNPDWSDPNAYRVSFIWRTEVFDRPSLFLHSRGVCLQIDNSL